VITREQLLELGWSPKAIKHRLATGRLHAIWPGVYVVGRPDVSRYGRWMAATLRCDGALSHGTAAMLWSLVPYLHGDIHVSVVGGHPEGRGLAVHRRKAFESTRHHRIPVTSPTQTLVDIAPTTTRDALEQAINEADKRRLIDPESLRDSLDSFPRTPGLGMLKATLDYRTFTLTDSQLERLFLAIVRRVGMPMPLTQQWVNGFRVDFYWPELRLVVETDGLTYHRTPAQQAADAVRDQTHVARGLTVLRFTRAQVKYEAGWVEEVLREVASARRTAATRPALP
jgi:very-short-patch-repair endonuclease